MSNNPKKTGRPISNNVDYFPHKCKDSKELVYIRHKYGSEGYEAFYRLQEALGDADYHYIDLNNDLKRQMFEMGMGVSSEVVYGVIDILAGTGWLDKEVYEKDNILWSDKFMKSIRAVYINRRRSGSIDHIPEKQDIYRSTTCRNRSIVEDSIEDIVEDTKEEGSNGSHSIFDFNSLISKYPDLDVEKSYDKYISYHNDPSEEGFQAWLDKDRTSGFNKKKVEFKKTPNGENIAYCSKCGKKEFPDKWQLKQGSTCHHVEYLKEKPGENVGATNL